ncbi:hypothetical protein T492DRAFT_915128 [Pavlovales sp. CCMP2436]|nr:hypothetical protein T492DRAFT_915128 [Pavlovales sp. CCMP2436]
MKRKRQALPCAPLSAKDLEGHMRFDHTGERLVCGNEGCDFTCAANEAVELETLWETLRETLHEALREMPVEAPARLVCVAEGCDYKTAVNASAEREALCEQPPSEEEGGELVDASSEPDFETKLSAAKEEAALAQRKLEKYKRALRKEKERNVLLRAELAAAQAAVKAKPVSAEANQGNGPATGEMEAVAAAHARELRIAQARLDAAGSRVVAMEARERAVAAQARADAAMADDYAAEFNQLSRISLADTHSLVKEIAAQGGRKMHALMGVSPMEAAARIKKQLIDTIGMIAARGHAQLLLARLSALAPIAAQPSAAD